MSSSIADSSIFTSKPFTFIVQGKPLYAHAALVAGCSEPFDRMINGHLSEANQGFAILDDVDESTFLRFIRWTYNKDYPANEHSAALGAEESKPPEANTVDDEFADWGSWGVNKKEKKKKKKHTTEPAVEGYLRESFISRQHDVELSPYTIPPARANKGPDEDYTEVFLGHARMYVFAEKYDIQPLKKLALQKLQHQLAIHTLYIERAGEILSLVNYVYGNTGETSGNSDDIRTMLAHYIGVEMANLMQDGEIRHIMQENGELLSDFLKMFALRVN
ncbi:hypothetical protein ACLMJK_003742 [Lecanora helva]